MAFERMEKHVRKFATTPDVCIHMNYGFGMCWDCGQVWDDKKNPIIQSMEVFACPVIDCPFESVDEAVVTKHMQQHRPFSKKIYYAETQQNKEQSSE